MYGTGTRRFFQSFAKVHGALLIRTKGRPASLGWGQKALVLETVGRRTGKVRAIPLLTLPDGDGFLLMASNYGQERPPAWWLNLQADPHAHILWKGTRLPVVARELEGEERAAVVERCRSYNAQWRMYLAEVHRHLPIVRLDVEG